MTHCWFNGLVNLSRGNIVKITRVIPRPGAVRVTVMENMTTGERRTSSDNGSLMTVLPVTLDEPIIGRVVSVTVEGNNVTNFVIEEGVEMDNVFIRAGDTGTAQRALTEILANQTNSYVKIIDPYISQVTINILQSVPSSVDVMLLTETISNLALVQAAIQRRRITIKRAGSLHDRFILTRKPIERLNIPKTHPFAIAFLPKVREGGPIQCDLLPNMRNEPEGDTIPSIVNARSGCQAMQTMRLRDVGFRVRV